MTPTFQDCLIGTLIGAVIGIGIVRFGFWLLSKFGKCGDCGHWRFSHPRNACLKPDDSSDIGYCECEKFFSAKDWPAEKERRALDAAEKERRDMAKTLDARNLQWRLVLKSQSGSLYQNTMNASGNLTMYWPFTDDAPSAPKPMEKVSSTEPIIAWRTWRIAKTEDGFRLMAMATDLIWTPAEPNGSSFAPTVAQSPAFARGIHAFKDAKEAVNYEFNFNDLGYGKVCGAVALWGKVIEHERGYRAQWAYPQTLYVHPMEKEVNARVRELARAYGCEVKGDDAAA